MSQPHTHADDAEMPQIGTHFADLTAALRHGADDSVDPGRLVHFAVAAIPSAEHCAVTLVQGHSRPRTLAATGRLTQHVDDLQYATGEGPRLDVVDHDDLVHVSDLATDVRWPAFGRRCVHDTGIHSVLSIRLRLGREDRAALNVYAAPPAAFTEIDMATGSIFAPFAAVAVQAALRQREVDNLKAALTSSRQIGTAIGILMAREHVTSDEAFTLLKEASNHLNRRLRDIAAEVEYTGELPQFGSTGSGSDPS